MTDRIDGVYHAPAFETVDDENLGSYEIQQEHNGVTTWLGLCYAAIIQMCLRNFWVASLAGGP